MMLVASQLMLGLTTLSVPLAAWAGRLSFEQLLALQAINGTLTVLATAASHAFMPSLVGSAYLAEANARLAASNSVARVTGPAVAGMLVQVLSAPVAILVDAISFLFCASCVAFVRSFEPASQSRPAHSVGADIKEALYLVLGHRLMRPMVLSLGTYNLFAAMFTGIYTLFMVRELAFSPLMVGTMFACGGTGGVLGGLIAGKAIHRFGTGRSIVASAVLLAVMHLAAPLVGGPPVVASVVLASAGALAQLGFAVLHVSETTLTQRLVPTHVLGGVSATKQVAVLPLVPLGFALGGAIGDSLGLRAAVGIGAIGTLLATLPLVRSRLWSSDAALMDANTLLPREVDASERDGDEWRPLATRAWRSALLR